MQSLYLGNDEWITIDRTFVDGGLPAKMGLSAGHVVEMAPAIAARPKILMAHGGFYYENRAPVTDPEDVSYLPPVFRAQALEWIKKQAGKAKPLPVTKGRATNDGRPIPPDRGHTARPPRVIDSEEQAERELIGGPGGLRELDREESRRRTL